MRKHIFVYLVHFWSDNLANESACGITFFSLLGAVLSGPAGYLETKRLSSKLDLRMTNEAVA